MDLLKGAIHHPLRFSCSVAEPELEPEPPGAVVFAGAGAGDEKKIGFAAPTWAPIPTLGIIQ